MQTVDCHSTEIWKKRTNDSAFIVNQWSVVDSGGSNKTKWPDSIEMCTNTIDAKAERRRKVIASIPLFQWLVRPCLWFGSTVARINAAVMSPFCFILHGVCYLISISGNFPLPYNNEPIRRINKRHAPPFRLLLIYSAKKMSEETNSETCYVKPIRFARINIFIWIPYPPAPLKFKAGFFLNLTEK